eukprot:SAG22_NODE_5244_length_1054_cov_1.378010_2_plen_40_part_01
MRKSQGPNVQITFFHTGLIVPPPPRPHTHTHTHTHARTCA